MRYFLLAAALGLAACGSDEGHHDHGDGHGGHGEAHGEARHDTSGEVTEISEGRVTIRHEEVPGVMQAMTMPFVVEDAAMVEGIEVGQRVDFTFEETEGRYILRAIAGSE